MANVIKLRKGLDINLKGKAAEELVTVKEPGFYALVPDDFPGVTPKVVVKEQEYVMAGGPLFIDKNHPEVKFVSPVSGVVTSVERGARRKVMNIVVEAAAEQDYEEFGKQDVARMNADRVKELLLQSGMFAFIKQRPYDVIADPAVAPRAIFVSAFDSNPLAPEFEFALKGEEANFQTGLDALAKIAKTYLGISVKQKSAALTQAKNVTITAFDGPNPAGNVGVQINRVAPVVKGETVWTIDPQAVIFIGRLMNTGGQDMYQVELSLDNLTTEGISLTGGFNSKMVSKIPIGGSTAFQFPLVAAADMAAGNYPVAIKLKYRDQFGKNYEKTNQFYVNVGGLAGRKAILEIRNMQEPGGTYGVNQNFTVSFDLKNTGAVAAKDIVVTAEGVDSAAVVPKSASMKNIQSLAPGSSASLSFTFAGTSQSATQNQAIQFTVEYTSGGTAKTTFKQYAGVNISNPSKEGEENTSKPKIIVSNYSCDPLIVMAGQEFDLNLTLMNTHKQKAVKNIKMYLTLAEETSSETQKSGNIFTPVNSSNTFYFDSIRPKGTVNKALRLYVVPEAQPKTYTLTVNFEYEDAKGTEYTATELLGINVKQVTELQIDDFTIPETVEQGMPVTVGFNYYNTGKVTLNNVMIKVEGNVDCQNKNTYVGNMESGSSDYFETTFTPYETGEVPVSIVITYEDPSGETVEQRRDMIMQVTEPAMPDDTENPDASAPMDKKHIAIGLGLLVILAGALAFFVKNQKEPPKSTAESVSSAEDLEDDFEEDDFVEEVTEVIHEDDKEGMSL